MPKTRLNVWHDQIQSKGGPEAARRALNGGGEAAACWGVGIGGGCGSWDRVQHGVYGGVPGGSVWVERLRASLAEPG
jgi:hypothetical protein